MKDTKYQILKYVFFAFILSTLLDPADTILGLKIPLYLSCWILTLILFINTKENKNYPLGLLVYSGLMISIPMLSIVFYYLMNGADPYEGFSMLKAYLFISCALFLYITKINAIKYLSRALFFLVILI